MDNESGGTIQNNDAEYHIGLLPDLAMNIEIVISMFIHMWGSI